MAGREGGGMWRRLLYVWAIRSRTPSCVIERFERPALAQGCVVPGENGDSPIYRQGRTERGNPAGTGYFRGNPRAPEKKLTGEKNRSGLDNPMF